MLTKRSSALIIEFRPSIILRVCGARCCTCVAMGTLKVLLRHSWNEGREQSSLLLESGGSFKKRQTGFFSYHSGFYLDVQGFVAPQQLHAVFFSRCVPIYWVIAEWCDHRLREIERKGKPIRKINLGRKRDVIPPWWTYTDMYKNKKLCI